MSSLRRREHQSSRLLRQQMSRQLTNDQTSKGTSRPVAQVSNWAPVPRTVAAVREFTAAGLDPDGVVMYSTDDPGRRRRPLRAGDSPGDICWEGMSPPDGLPPGCPVPAWDAGAVPLTLATLRPETSDQDQSLVTMDQCRGNMRCGGGTWHDSTSRVEMRA